MMSCVANALGLCSWLVVVLLSVVNGLAASDVVVAGVRCCS